MAVTSLAPARSAARSTVALKAIMALSGLIMLGYLILHMYGNLKVFAGQAKFDEYAHHLRIIGEPVLPYSGLLWVVRVVLVVSVLAHIYAACVVAAGADRARRDQALLQQQGQDRGPAQLRLVHAALGRPHRSRCS